MADTDKETLVEFEFPDEKEVKEEKKPHPKDVEKEAKEEKEESVEVVDDTPEEDRGRKDSSAPEDVSDEELSKYTESVAKRIKRFNRGYHDERRAKENALRERDEAMRIAEAIVAENNRLKGTLNQGQAALVDQTKKVVSAELEEAKRKYKAAYEAGDSDALLAAQEELVSAKMKAERVNSFRPATLQPTKDEVQSKPQPVQVDPRAKAWQNDNPWFGQDRKKTRFALLVHQELIEDEGIDPQSDKYYEELNKRVRNQFREEGTPAPEPRSKTSVVAPVSRNTANKKVVLTQTQVRLANKLGVPLEAYARHVRELEKERNE